MQILDVNILVGAHHVESPHHAGLRPWLEDLIAARQPFGVPEVVLYNFARVVTLPRPWKRPSTIAQAMAFCRVLRSLGSCVVLQPSEQHWQLFKQLSVRIAARGNLVNDTYLAVYALERGAEWVTLDRDYAKFPGLVWRHPLEARSVRNPG